MGMQYGQMVDKLGNFIRSQYFTETGELIYIYDDFQTVLSSCQLNLG